MSHEKVETNVSLLMILVIIVVSIGGLVEIVPLFFLKDTTKPVEGLKPYTALQLEGRDIYIREGCYLCHSQMIRPFRAETERYGHYSVAGEFVYDHPFQWGSKRTGPDLARIGGRYSDDWHRIHLQNPRLVVPESNMPGFPWLAKNKINYEETPKKMKVMRELGVPYSLTEKEYESNVKHFGKNVADELKISGAEAAVKGKTELDALIAYLQCLGTDIKSRR